jgi:hypothetical protein
MKCLLRAPALMFFLTFLSMNVGFAADNVASSGDGPALEDQAGKQTPAMALAAEVSEIANFKMMSHSKKEKRIANAVRIAVVAATAYKDQAETVNIAAELAAAAAAAAPPFTDAIIHAVSFTPAVARIDGASGQIQAAADYAAAQTEKTPQVAVAGNAVEPGRTTATPTPPSSAENVVQAGPVEPAAVSGSQAPSAPPEKTAGSQPVETAATPPTIKEGTKASIAENGAEQDRSNPWTLPKIDLGNNASLHFTADLGARYDDNIFLTRNGTVSDEILTETPGAVFQFGQNSLANGSLSYEESFLEYAHKSSSAQRLGTGTGDFGYGNERLDLKANADYEQFAQNQEGFFIPGQNVVVRRDQLDVGSSAEVHFTEKTSAGVGANYSDTHYQTPGLIDNKSYSWPVNLYYSIRPKVDLSAGFTQSEIKTPGSGPGSTQINSYYNIGARGDFTPKLSGGFSVGYTTSKITQTSNTDLLAFNGNFSYEMSPKTNLTLTGSRNFTAGPQGEQLKNTSFSLTASTAFSPRWQGNATLGYQNIAYPAPRTDNYVEGDVSATYIYSKNISATISYDLRHNASTVSTAEFLDNMLSLDVGLKY